MAEDNVKVCWVTGSHFQRKDTISQIKEMMGGEKNIESLVCDEWAAEKIETETLATGLFDSGKVKIFILKEIPPFFSTNDKDNKKWIDFLSKISDKRLIIIDNVSSTSKPTIYKAVKKIGKVIEFPEYLKRQEAVSMIMDTASVYNKVIDMPEAELLVDAIGEEAKKGYNMDRLFMALKKIKIYMEPRRKEISKEDIYAMIPMKSEFIIWNLFKALDQRNFSLSLKLLYDAIGQASSAKKGVEGIMPLFSWRYNLLFLLKEAKAKKQTDQEIIESIKSIVKVKKDGSGLYATLSQELTKENKPQPVYTDSVVRNALQGFYGKTPDVELYSRRELLKIMKCIDECQYMVRASSDEVECRMMGENLLMTVCDVLDETTLTGLRNLPYDTTII
jgi:DNA polymerase III delta subunit